MKKILSGLLIIGFLGGGAASIHAAEENVNGTNSASITVNGSLGQDNEDENAPNIDEGSDDWINVTLDTANIFYTTKDSQHKTITSPDYTITNNSGRAVKISTEDFTVTSGNLDNVDALKISGADYSAAEKSVDLKTFAEGEFLTLANNQGKMNVDTDAQSTHANTTTYKYSGTTKDEYYKGKAEQTAHTLTLAFEALGKDGNPVAP